MGVKVLLRCGILVHIAKAVDWVADSSCISLYDHAKPKRVDQVIAEFPTDAVAGFWFHSQPARVRRIA